MITASDIYHWGIKCETYSQAKHVLKFLRKYLPESYFWSDFTYWRSFYILRDRCIDWIWEKIRFQDDYDRFSYQEFEKENPNYKHLSKYKL